MRKRLPLLLACALAAQALPTASPARADRPAQWSMFKFGVTRAARTRYLGPQSNALAWQHFLKGSGIQSQLAIARDGTVYAGSVEGTFFAIRSDGSLRWKVRLGSSQITSGPAIADDGTVYISPENGGLHAFDPHGTEKWIFPLTGYGGPAASPALGADGTIYVGTDKLTAIHPDGTLKWSYDTGAYIAGPPAVAGDGTVYFASANSLYALDASGGLKWHSPGRSQYPLGSAPAIGRSGNIYVNTNDGVLHAFRSDGSLAWKFRTSGIVVDVPSSPAIGKNETIYFGGGGEYQGNGGYFYALSHTGHLLWKFFAGCDQTAPAIDADGTIYFASDYCGTVHALNPFGSELWAMSNPFDYMRSAPVIGRNDRLYVGALAGPATPDKGGLFAFGP